MLRTKLSGDHFMLLEAAEIVSAADSNTKWLKYQENLQRTMPVAQFLKKVQTGDEDLVLKSEEILRAIEDQVPVSLGWRNVEDVVGSVPNVPAYLAGHPQCMRRRERTMRETAPLTIFMDLTSGMGIPHDTILRRGIVLLALVRRLVEHRSVELWVGTAMGDGGGSYGRSYVTAWKIDTAPLDLARAAFHIADSSMSRLFGYAMCESLVDRHIGGFGNVEQCQKSLKEIGGWYDFMYIPAIKYNDPMVDTPVEWLKRVMHEYVGGDDD